MSFMNMLRKIEKIRFYVVLFIVGLLFTAVSVFILAQPAKEYSYVDGTIQDIIGETVEGEPNYRVLVSYTDEKGIEHTNVEYPSYSSFMKKGDTVKVAYDPAMPEEIHSPSAEKLPYIFLVIGVAAMAIPVAVIVIKGKKAEIDEQVIASPFEDDDLSFDAEQVRQVDANNEPPKDFYFHFTGKLNQSYILETPEREPIYEAICDHIGVFTPYQYRFVDHRINSVEDHTVTHTKTLRYGNGSDNMNFSVVSNSTFHIDGVSIWEYLTNLGYAVKANQKGIKLNFDVLHYGVPVARLEAAGVNILNDEKKYKLGDKLTSPGLYKVSCKESDIPGVFAACFCVSRVEFY